MIVLQICSHRGHAQKTFQSACVPSWFLLEKGELLASPAYTARKGDVPGCRDWCGAIFCGYRGTEVPDGQERAVSATTLADLTQHHTYTTYPRLSHVPERGMKITPTGHRSAQEEKHFSPWSFPSHPPSWLCQCNKFQKNRSTGLLSHQPFCAVALREVLELGLNWN